jgi:hypothetical protein
MKLSGKIDIGREPALSGQQRPVLEPPYRSAEVHALISAAAARTAFRMF